VSKSSHRAEAEQLRLARLVQEALLPPPRTNLPGLALATRFLPSTQVSGDFLDHFTLSPRTLAFYLGDVQGKGLEAAFYALLISGLMRGLHKTGTEPADVLTSLNRRLYFHSRLHKFCCLSYAVLDVEQRQLKYTSAGLPFPLLFRRGSITALELTGPPVGMFDLYECDQMVLDLQAGDELLFYTDGLPDCLRSLRPSHGDGGTQLQELLASVPHSSAEQQADALVARLRDGRGRCAHILFDDVTFLLVKLL
jgi:sigma-B regulation protein RsbU (phosphoserine phosphatase)